MMTKAFSFILKAPFVLKIFEYLLGLFSQVEKHLNENTIVKIKIYHVITWETKIAVHIFPNISRVKTIRL